MTDIPEDIMREARAVRVHFSDRGPTLPPWSTLEAHIARSIHAAEKRGAERERERCARIAERDGSSHDATFSQQTAEWHRDTALQVRTADRIAAAIRKEG